jgi:ribosomal protein L11 methyltransferase
MGMNDIYLSAGAKAFGDGAHPTTRGVLEALAMIDPQAFTPSQACDIGAGAGLLSFALHQQFGCPVLAVELERAAFAVLQENIAINDAGEHITALHADGFAHPEIGRRAPFDLVVMNILAEPLRRLAAAAVAHLVEGGVLILAGIMVAQEDGIKQVYQSLGLELTSRIVIGDWVTLLWQKP